MSYVKIAKLSCFILAGVFISTLLPSCAVPSLPDNNDQTLEATESAQTPLPTAQVEIEPAESVKINPELSEAYLVNPGIGWQDGPDPYGIMNFPETVAYSNRRLISWEILNPANGVYDWSALDAQLTEAAQAGKQFSFRIYSYVGEGFDGDMIPVWVHDEGANLKPSGEPDYSNCSYQEAWGEFITELVRVYDGHPDIAFIDISGYGNFGEWSWRDEQTEWDEQWDEDYTNGTPSPASFQTLDGSARRRLADVFIGGSFNGHVCRLPDGTIIQVDYAYPGFQKTQLLMPYAGIVQSSQYVHFRRSDIGFRYDCLGRDGVHLVKKIGDRIIQNWVHAPVVYELCKPSQMDPEDALWLLHTSHASIVHNNNWRYSRGKLEDLMRNVGYRYYLREANIKIEGIRIDIQMEWQNIGLAPIYPRMGQLFSLYLYLLDPSGGVILRELVPVDISSWLPAASAELEQPSYWIAHSLNLPSPLPEDSYQVGVSILDERTGMPINLAFDGRNETGIHVLYP